MVAQGHPKTLFMRAKTLKKYGIGCKRNEILAEITIGE
jgi:hypothetical protein